jgi:type I restriction enzyme S subunit
MGEKERVKMAKISDVAKQIRGVSYTPSDVSDALSHGHLAILRANNITEYGIKLEEFVYVDKKCVSEKQLLKVGDILIAASSGSKNIVGRAIFIDESINASFGAFCKVVRPNEKVDANYLGHYFKSPGYRRTISHLSAGANINNIRNEDIDNLEIPLPPLHTQKRIAEILDKADALRKKDKQLLQYYDDLAQSLFIDMFGDPVRNEKGWEITTIGDICFYVKDGPHVSPKYSTTGVPFISVNNIIRGFIDLSNAKSITHEDYILYSKKGKPEKGDILYTKGGTTGFAKRVDVDFEFMNWVHIAILKFDKNIINEVFFESMLNTNFCYAQSQRLTKGIANRDLVLGEMKKIKILLPPLSLQREFAKQIQNIEQQKEKLKAQMQESENLFQALLQQAFNGGLN